MNLGISRFTPLLTAVILAAVFHLSMVSIFSIVINVPKNSERFSSLEVVKLEPPKPQRPRRGQLRLRLAPRLVPQPPPPAQLALPKIELPQLQLPDLQKNQTEEQRLQINMQLGEMLDQRPEEGPDSWAMFTQELRDLGRAITGMPEIAAQQEPAPTMRVTNVAPGFDLEITWMSEPKSRKLLFSPPVEALWRLDPASVQTKITLVFTTDPDGRVVDVQSPSDDETSIVGQLEAALRQYRFEALDLETAKQQQGALSLSTEARQE